MRECEKEAGEETPEDVKEKGKSEISLCSALTRSASATSRLFWACSGEGEIGEANLNRSDVNGETHEIGDRRRCKRRIWIRRRRQGKAMA